MRKGDSASFPPATVRPPSASFSSTFLSLLLLRPRRNKRRGFLIPPSLRHWSAPRSRDRPSFLRRRRLRLPRKEREGKGRRELETRGKGEERGGRRRGGRNLGLVPEPPFLPPLSPLAVAERGGERERQTGAKGKKRRWKSNPPPLLFSSAEWSSPDFLSLHFSVRDFLPTPFPHSLPGWREMPSVLLHVHAMKETSVAWNVLAVNPLFRLQFPPDPLLLN